MLAKSTLEKFDLIDQFDNMTERNVIAIPILYQRSNLTSNTDSRSLNAAISIYYLNVSHNILIFRESFILVQHSEIFEKLFAL